MLDILAVEGSVEFLQHSFTEAAVEPKGQL